MTHVNKVTESSPKMRQLTRPFSFRANQSRLQLNRTPMLPKNTSRVARQLLDISSHPQDGWEVLEKTPVLGDVVLSVEGFAEVVRVLGKVSDGSRLLELKIVDREGPSFFAATSNVAQELEADS